MNYGFVVPFSDARLVAGLAAEAETAGWDGIFVADLVWGVDAWVQLTAAAMVTERIRLGTMLTPLPWKQPWKLAGEISALDNLSGGRVILSLGLGAPDAGARGFFLPEDRRLRAELLDEGLDVVQGLWSTPSFQYEGKHYRVQPTDFPAPPPPVQQPRVTTWCVGIWPREKSMRRVLRCDGLIPSAAGGQVSREALPGIVAWVQARRDPAQPFDYVIEGETGAAGEGSDEVAAWARAGATWWMETRWMASRDDAGERQVRERIAAGPPRPGA